MDILIPEWPAPSSIRAVITTRLGGVSTKPWDSFNLAYHVGDNPQKVTENWHQLSQKLCFQSFPQLLNQTHGTEIIEARCDETIPNADGCFSHTPGRVCVVMTADCLPVFLCNTAGTEVAIIHAGWRGLAAGILSRAMSCFSSQPCELMAYLGPAISQQYFEVGDEVRQAFLRRTFQQHSSNRVSGCFIQKEHGSRKWMADLYELARVALQEGGVEQVYGGDFCTYADKERFYSYRREGQTGRMASLIWIS